MGTSLNRLSEAVLTSTHNLCFRAKIKKNITIFHLKIIIFENFILHYYYYYLYYFANFKNICIMPGYVCVMDNLNPYVTIGLSHLYYLDESTFIYRGIRTNN